MYKFTRPEVAEKLNISTRSVDRYIRSWKLRSKKEWKIVYINTSDVENLLLWSWSKQEVIIPKVIVEEKSIVSIDKIEKENKEWNNVSWTLDLIYKDLREDIKKKDNLIQWLSQRLWQNEEIAKNSVSLIEYKKSQFLLDESKWYLSNEVEKLKEEKGNLENEIKKERNYNVLLLIFVVILIVMSLTVWFIKI